MYMAIIEVLVGIKSIPQRLIGESVASNEQGRAARGIKSNDVSAEAGESWPWRDSKAPNEETCTCHFFIRALHEDGIGREKNERKDNNASALPQSVATWCEFSFMPCFETPRLGTNASWHNPEQGTRRRCRDMFAPIPT
ncbi:hypothetical protein PG996_015348 [Apiospora saccharicola]|uniref:Uncharacterized protein n=1 Tax=Apiospora saccharicola TaxID=335842 RepID=A0ABR1TNJ6_9PEZI